MEERLGALSDTELPANRITAGVLTVGYGLALAFLLFAITDITDNIYFIGDALLVGLVVGGSYVAYEHQRESRIRRRVRRALRTEIEAISDRLERMNENNGTSGPDGIQLPTRVYDSNTEKIGLLDDEEAQPVIKFYADVADLNRRLSQRAQRRTDASATESDSIDETISSMIDRSRVVRNTLRTG